MTAKPTNSRKRKARRSGRAEAWNRQAGWLLKTIRALDETPTGHGLKWTAKMIAHYYKQYETLCRHTPPACKAQRAVYDEEILRIMDKHESDL